MLQPDQAYLRLRQNRCYTATVVKGIARAAAKRIRSHGLALLLTAATVGVLHADSIAGCPILWHQLTFVNNDAGAKAGTLTIVQTPGCYGTATGAGLVDNNGNHCWPFATGSGVSTKDGSFSLAPGKSVTVSAPACWSGNFGVQCATCSAAVKGPVKTLAEFTFDGGVQVVGSGSSATVQKIMTGNGTPALDDTYDVSLVDGFTRALQIQPGDQTRCNGPLSSPIAGCQSVPACPSNQTNSIDSSRPKINLADGDACLSPNQYVRRHPDQFQPKDASGLTLEQTIEKYGCICSSTDASISCKNASVPPANCPFGCSPFSSPGNTNPGSACCPFPPGDTDPAHKCQATSAVRAWDAWALAFIANIHQNCPGEYAWPYDDTHGTFACTGGEQNYTVTVLPSPPPSARRVRTRR